MIIKTWDELIHEIKKYKNSLPPKTELWYRGQGNADYVLLPGLLRQQQGPYKEKEIFETYRKLSVRFYPSTLDDWELLIDMQNNFVPTRLLDWSENLGIALFFALSNNSDNSDMGLYVLNPDILNKNMNIDGIPVFPETPMGLSYNDSFVDTNSYYPQCPIAIRTNFHNQRVSAQRCMFTVHGRTIMPLEELCPSAVKKFVISNAAAESINEFLDIANINEFTVFPDMFGVARYIRNLLIL